MAEQKNEEWKVYVIPDLRTWANPKEYEQQTPIEYYRTFEQAKKRFDELRNEPYNSEKAFAWDGSPSARLTLGIQRNRAAIDVIHVRGGENYLVEDFIRSKDIYENPEAMAIIRQTADKIGFEKVNSYPLLENGNICKSSVVIPFDVWAAEHTQFNLTGGNKTMERTTTFDVSSISKIENGGNVKAIANVVINGELAVRGVKVMDGEKGLFVAMPSKKMGRDYGDVAFPITAEARTALNTAVMDSYNQLMMSGEKTLKSDVPTNEQTTSSVKVSLKPIEGNSHLKAAGQITVDNCFVVKDVKVLETAGKPPFVSMPSYQTQTGDYADYALPITKAMHEKIDNAVLGSYQSLGKVEYKGVKYAELGASEDIAHLPKQNNTFAAKLMAELDKAGIKYQAKIEGTTTISVNKADKPKLDSIKNELVKALNPEKQNITPKHNKR